MLNEEIKKKIFVDVNFAREIFVIDASGALFWPRLEVMVISDIHFEKGSYFAAKSQPLPLYDTRDTLARIEKLIQHYSPRQVISLGDNVHDANALQRMQADDLTYLNKICASVTRWDWIVGNHDKGDFKASPLAHMNFSTAIVIDGITFTHDLMAAAEYQIIGHYHPKISVKTKVNKISGKCFVLTPSKIMLPAFGSYTGGLNVEQDVFQTLLQGEKAKYYFIDGNIILRAK